MSSLPVAMANLIVARTARMSGVHLSPSDAAFPPRKYDRFPIFACEHRNMPSRCAVHFAQRNRKCSTVSDASPHSQVSDSTVPILHRKLLSLTIPVRSCDSTSASSLFSGSYRVRVCLPGSAVSICFEHFPTLSGSVLVCRCLVIASLILVDLARCGGTSGLHSPSVAFRAAALAFGPSAKSSSPAGTHNIRREWPSSSRRFIWSYICRMICWPDCCRGRRMASSAERLLVMTVTSRQQSPDGIHLNTISIAPNSAMYRFSSSVNPRVME